MLQMRFKNVEQDKYGEHFRPFSLTWSIPVMFDICTMNLIPLIIQVKYEMSFSDFLPPSIEYECKCHCMRRKLPLLCQQSAWMQLLEFLLRFTKPILIKADDNLVEL